MYYDTYIKPQLGMGSNQFDTPHKQKASTMRNRNSSANSP
jgi:hypothetical protein